MNQAYRIKNWTDRENSETRKYVDLLWFRTKVKLVGEGLGHTLSQPNGPHLYGMFKLIEQIAAGGRQDQRGWLFRNGTPLNAQRIANLLRLPVADCQEALTFFSTAPLDWIELAEYLGESPGDPPPNNNPTAPHGSDSGESPGALPPKTAKHASCGQGSGESPGDCKSAGRISASEKLTNILTKVPRERERESSAPPSMAEVLTSRTRAGLLMRQIRELEADRANLSEADREGLRKKKRDLAALQAKQADGDFSYAGGQTKTKN